MEQMSVGGCVALL